MSDPPPPPQVSPDGKFYWDGTRWVPVQAAPPPIPPPIPPPRSGGWGRTIIVGAVCLILGAICGTAVASSSQSNRLASGGNSATGTPSPVSTPSARQAVTVSGTGSKVITPFHLGRGNYKVSWTAQGHANFIVHIRLGDQVEFLVNEIPPSPSSGETVFASPDEAEYTLEVQASTLTWSIIFTPI